MERRIGQVDMIRWQGRRLDAQTRAKSRIARVLLWVCALSALSLVVGFYSGLPIPIDTLQTVFVLLLGAMAILGGWSLLVSMLGRNEGQRVVGGRR